MDRCTSRKKPSKHGPNDSARASARYAASNAWQPDVFGHRRDLITDVEYLRSVRGRTSMSTKTTKFLTDWLRWHVVGRVASAEDIPVLAAKCLQEAWREGISGCDIEVAVGSLEDCIRQALLQVKK